jgi:hypothetical protein
MDPNATLRMIEDAPRLDAACREAMATLHGWIAGGGFEPDWAAYPKGTKRYRRIYHGQTRANPAEPSPAQAELAKIAYTAIVWHLDPSIARDPGVLTQAQEVADEIAERAFDAGFIQSE